MEHQLCSQARSLQILCSTLVATVLVPQRSVPVLALMPLVFWNGGSVGLWENC